MLLLNGLMSAQMRGVLLPYLSAIPFTAANDNPGGAKSVEVELSSFVTVMAKAYVAKTHAKERSA